MVKLWIGEHAQAVAEHAVDLIEQTIKGKPACVLGLATGSTPLKTYQEMIRRYREGRLDFSQVTTFNLDEYYGLDENHPQSYHSFMYENLFRYINIPRERIHIPSGTPQDIEAYCRHYDQRIAESGGIDLQLLGIGPNGHIGFNEPADELQAGTHLVRLTEDTIQANARFFPSIDDVPRQAITMGMKTILSARKIILLAEGEGKAMIIKKLMESAITTRLPASFLRLHPDVTILIDREAAKYLPSSITGEGHSII